MSQLLFCRVPKLPHHGCPKLLFCRVPKLPHHGCRSQPSAAARSRGGLQSWRCGTADAQAGDRGRSHWGAQDHSGRHRCLLHPSGTQSSQSHAKQAEGQLYLGPLCLWRKYSANRLYRVSGVQSMQSKCCTKYAEKVLYKVCIASAVQAKYAEQMQYKVCRASAVQSMQSKCCTKHAEQVQYKECRASAVQSMQSKCCTKYAKQVLYKVCNASAVQSMQSKCCTKHAEQVLYKVCRASTVQIM